MITLVEGKCSCGVVVKGELDEKSRECIHRFILPPGAEDSVQAPRTEVEEVHLVTFALDSRAWSLVCPLCGKEIRIGSGS
jgi:hypothetical protein